MPSTLPTTPGAIIGYRRNGDPIRLIAGASPDDPGNTPTDPPAPDDPPADPALSAALADVDKWRNLSRQHETRAKANADKATKFDAAELANAEEVAKLTAERDTLNGEVSVLRTEKMQRDAAAAAKLPTELAVFITATDEAGAKKQAELLAARLPVAGHDQGVRTGSTHEPAPGVDRLRSAYAEREATR